MDLKEKSLMIEDPGLKCNMEFTDDRFLATDGQMAVPSFVGMFISVTILFYAPRVHYVDARDGRMLKVYLFLRKQTVQI